MASLAMLDAILGDIGASQADAPSVKAAMGGRVAPQAAVAAKTQTAAAAGAKAVNPKAGAQAAPAALAAPAAQAADADPAVAAELARKLELVLSVGEECQTVDDLKNLLAKKPNFVCYDGFEPSGRMHIAQGLFKAINVNKLTSVGGTFVFWVADWFALMNDKMGGDLVKIQTVGKYLIEVWKAAGMDMSRVKFLWCADEISSNAHAYWPKMLDIARCFDLDRIKKCCMIMARNENTLSGAQILYPLMQCTDIFFLRADVCQLGVDQRKVNMLARDYCTKAGIKLKPVILSHHMLYGLKPGQAKMSKSDPDSAIFMEDSAADVERKLQQAHCPRELPADEPAAAEGAAAAAAADESDPMHLVKDPLQNPCLDYIKHIVMTQPGGTFAAAGKVYTTAADVRAAFLAGDIPEAELKRALIEAVNKVLQPVRDHFERDPAARKLLAQVRLFSKEPVAPSLRRLALLSEADRACIVCAPVLSSHVTLGAVLSTLRQLEAAPDGTQPVLWLRDWSAIALNCFGGQPKPISAAYTVFVGALRAVRPELMARTRVEWQSEAILKDPSNYWISVIDVGRRFSLVQLQALEPAPANEQAGFVVKVLMHTADMLALCPAAVRCAPADEPLARFAEAYRAEFAAALPATHVQAVEPCLVQLREPPTPDTSIAECEYTVLDSAAADAGTKMKKAFCAQGDVSFCPPLRLAQELIRLGSALSIKRKPVDGGDVEYADPQQLEADFAAGALHPGDLKPAVVVLVQATLTAIAGALKETAELKKAEADLKTALKALAKKK